MAPHKLLLSLLSYFAFAALLQPARAQVPEKCTQIDVTAAKDLKTEIMELTGSTPDGQPFPLAPKLQGHRILTETLALADRCDANAEALIDIATSLYMLTTFADDAEHAQQIITAQYRATINMENQSSKDYPNAAKSEFVARLMDYGESTFFQAMVVDGLRGQARNAYLINETDACPYVIQGYVEYELRALLNVFQDVLERLPNEQGVVPPPVDYRLQGLVKACPQKARSAQRLRAIMTADLASRTFFLPPSSMPNSKVTPRIAAVAFAREAYKLYNEVSTLPVDPFISQQENESLAKGDRAHMDDLATFIEKYDPPSAPSTEIPD